MDKQVLADELLGEIWAIISSMLSFDQVQHSNPMRREPLPAVQHPKSCSGGIIQAARLFAQPRACIEFATYLRGIYIVTNTYTQLELLSKLLCTIYCPLEYYVR